MPMSHDMDPYIAYQEGLTDGRSEAADVEIEMLELQARVIETNDIIIDWMAVGTAMVGLGGDKVIEFETDDIKKLIEDSRLAMGKAIW